MVGEYQGIRFSYAAGFGTKNVVEGYHILCRGRFSTVRPWCCRIRRSLRCLYHGVRCLAGVVPVPRASLRGKKAAFKKHTEPNSTPYEITHGDRNMETATGSMAIGVNLIVKNFLVTHVGANPMEMKTEITEDVLVVLIRGLLPPAEMRCSREMESRLCRINNCANNCSRSQNPCCGKG